MAETEEQGVDALIRAGADTDDLDDYDAGDRGDTVRPEHTGEPENDPSPDSASTRAAEPEPEASSEPEPEAKAEEPKGEPRIPKRRFDEINERRKAAEAKLAEYERAHQAKKQAPEFDFEAKEKAYLEAVLDGETDKAMALRREIRAAERAAWEAQVAEASSRTREMTKAELELTTTVQELQSTYPVFDAESETFDEGLTQEALDLFEGFKVRGYAPAAAMRKAVGYVVAANSLETPAAPSASSASSVPQRPSAAQVQRKLEAATQQPPQPAGTPPEPSIDVMRMSEEDFDKLSEAELRKLRGDLV